MQRWQAKHQWKWCMTPPIDQFIQFSGVGIYASNVLEVTNWFPFPTLEENGETETSCGPDISSYIIPSYPYSHYLPSSNPPMLIFHPHTNPLLPLSNPTSYPYIPFIRDSIPPCMEIPTLLQSVSKPHSYPYHYFIYPYSHISISSPYFLSLHHVHVHYHSCISPPSYAHLAHSFLPPFSFYTTCLPNPLLVFHASSHLIPYPSHGYHHFHIPITTFLSLHHTMFPLFFFNMSLDPFLPTLHGHAWPHYVTSTLIPVPYPHLPICIPTLF